MDIKERVNAAVEWIEARANSASDHWLVVWTWLTLAMIVFTLLSWPIGVAWVTFNGAMGPEVSAAVRSGGDGATPIAAKEVGYFAALNWSFYGALLMPTMLIFIVRIWSSMPRTIRSLSEAGMIRDKAFAPLSSEEVERRWARVQAHTALVFVTIFLCVIGVAMADWWEVVAAPLIHPDLMKGVPLDHPSYEYDWSIASLYDGAKATRIPLLIYGFVAYLLIPGIATGLTFATLICTLYFIAFLCGHIGVLGERLELTAVPVNERDILGGFGRFTPLFSMFVGLCLIVAVACLLMIIQNAYLRDPASTGVVSFMANDYSDVQAWREETISGLDLKIVWAWVVKPTKLALQNPQTVIGTFLLALTCIVSLGASWIFLGLAARAARNRSLDNLAALAKELKTTRPKLTQRLDEMEFWPVGWLKLNQLLVILGCFALAVISYRLLAAIGLLVLWLLSKAFFEAFKTRRKRRRS